MSSQIFGMYKATVKRNNDPLSKQRLILRIPQVLGEADSEWAEGSDPTSSIPKLGDVVWVQFSGGDVTKPVYISYGIPSAASTPSLLASTSYDPEDMTETLVESVLFADTDATNLAVIFTAPASGYVIAVLSATMGAFGAGMRWSLYEGATMVPNSDLVMRQSFSNSSYQVTYRAKLAASAGAHTWKWAHAIYNGEGVNATIYGGMSGAALMEVWSA